MGAVGLSAFASGAGTITLSAPNVAGSVDVVTRLNPAGHVSGLGAGLPDWDGDDGRPSARPLVWSVLRSRCRGPGDLRHRTQESPDLPPGRLLSMRAQRVMAGFHPDQYVTVLILVGILAVTALPRMFDRNTFESRGFFDETKSILRYAQGVRSRSAATSA